MVRWRVGDERVRPQVRVPGEVEDGVCGGRGERWRSRSVRAWVRREGI